MKTLRHMGTAISAMVLCMSLTACSDDEQGDSETSITQKYITSQLFQNDYGSTSYSVDYDTNNRLTKIETTSVDRQGSVGQFSTTNRTMVINYDKSQIIYTSSSSPYRDEEELLTFKLNRDGCIVEITDMNGNEAQFTYDSDKHLTNSTYRNATSNYTETTSHTWQNGNLISIDTKRHDGSSIDKFTFFDTLNKGNIQPFYGIWDNSLWRIFPTEQVGNLILSSGLFGKLSRNLPSQISSQYTDSYGRDTYTYNFEYRTDSKGFVSSMTMNSKELCGGLEYEDTETASFSYKE